MKGTPFDVHHPTTTELRAALDPDPAVWSTVTERAATREATGPDGRSFTRRDTMLRLVRTQASA